MATYIFPLHFIGTYWTVHDGDIYVSYKGSDTSGNGSPAKPYQTIAKAITIATTGKKIVIGTGQYNESINGGSKNCKLVADGTVIMTGPGTGTAFSSMGAASEVTGINRISGYPVAFDGIGKIESCFVLGGTISGTTGTIKQCVLKDTIMTPDTASVFTQMVNCTLINVSFTSSESFSRIENCHFDSTTVVRLNSANITFFDHCNQESGSGVIINNVVYATPQAVTAVYAQFQVNGIAAAPLFNSPEKYDYTLQASSPLLFTGSNGTYIGAWGYANEYNSTNLGVTVLTNVTIDTNGYYVLVDNAYEGTIETAYIDLGSIRSVGHIGLYAEQLFNTNDGNAVVDFESLITKGDKITFQMKSSTYETGMRLASYKEYRWDCNATQDVNGKGNGDPAFDIATAAPVLARYVQFRITLREPSFYILDEDGTRLLQEDTGKFILNI